MSDGCFVWAPVVFRCVVGGSGSLYLSDLSDLRDRSYSSRSLSELGDWNVVKSLSAVVSPIKRRVVLVREIPSLAIYDYRTSTLNVHRTNNITAWISISRVVPSSSVFPHQPTQASIPHWP